MASKVMTVEEAVAAGHKWSRVSRKWVNVLGAYVADAVTDVEPRHLARAMADHAITSSAEKASDLNRLAVLLEKHTEIVELERLRKQYGI